MKKLLLLSLLLFVGCYALLVDDEEIEKRRKLAASTLEKIELQSLKTHSGDAVPSTPPG